MEYDQIVADDKVLDKGFRREFGDLSVQQADNLYKHFRKRPRYVTSEWRVGPGFCDCSEQV